MRTILTLFLTTIALARAGWIDPDTPEMDRNMTSLIDGSIYNLVRMVFYFCRWMDLFWFY